MLGSRMSTLYRNIVSFTLVILFCQQSWIPLTDPIERVRSYTRAIEFDYTTWTLDALKVKLDQALVGLDGYVSTEQSSGFVLRYIELTRIKQEYESQLVQIYSNPDVRNPTLESQPILDQLDLVKKDLNYVSPIAEGILQNQISQVATSLQLSFIGQPIPPLLFHATPLPQALIVSPRDTIRQDANISLKTNLPLQDVLKIESEVSKGLNVSSLVEDVGGIGTYPTMVQQTSDINWLCEVVSHEWIHNYLQLRPLGLNYDTNSDLRTMNETTASLAGKEIAREVIRQYYPNFLPVPDPAVPTENERLTSPEELSPPEFDFRAEMHATRIRVDELLSKGKISEAESYMEEQREYFWDHGYQIRKLNQAYFAFHGAYADEPGGAAGSDPVGPAVRELRTQSSSLAAFIHKISRMTSFEQLKRSISKQ